MSGMLWQIRGDVVKSLEDALTFFSAKYGFNPIRIELNPVHDILLLHNVPVVHNDRVQKTNAWLILEEEEQNGDFTLEQRW